MEHQAMAQLREPEDPSSPWPRLRVLLCRAVAWWAQVFPGYPPGSSLWLPGLECSGFLEWTWLDSLDMTRQQILITMPRQRGRKPGKSSRRFCGFEGIGALGFKHSFHHLSPLASPYMPVGSCWLHLVGITWCLGNRTLWRHRRSPGWLRLKSFHL